VRHTARDTDGSVLSYPSSANTDAGLHKHSDPSAHLCRDTNINTNTNTNTDVDLDTNT
jgi:hypothetical protein